jgi:hypothetical protein
LKLADLAGDVCGEPKLNSLKLFLKEALLLLMDFFLDSVGLRVKPPPLGMLSGLRGARGDNALVGPRHGMGRSG